MSLKLCARFAARNFCGHSTDVKSRLQHYHHIRRLHFAIHHAHRQRMHYACRNSPWSGVFGRSPSACAFRPFWTRCFSTLNVRLSRPICRPQLFSPNYLYNLTVKANPSSFTRTFATAFSGFLVRERHILSRLFAHPPQVSEAFAQEARKTLESNKARKFIHNHGNLPKPTEAIQNWWQGQSSRYKHVRTRPLNPPSFIFPRPSLDSTLDYSFTSSSSLPSLSVLARAFHSTPDTGSYVDFDLSPTITIPPVTQLSTDIVDHLTEDIERHIDQLKSMIDNLKKLSNLGELPISVEDSALRVYFPNCEPDQVDSLLNSSEVTQGVIRSHHDSTIVSPIDSSSESSYQLTSSLSSSYTPSSGSQSVSQSSDLMAGFYYADVESISGRHSHSSESWDIARLRGFSSESEASPSMPPPSLTHAASGDTISEGSSFFYAS